MLGVDDLKLALRRLVAYWLDFVLLAMVLLGVQWLLYTVSSGFPFDYLETGWQIEIWVLATISLPVWLYFICCERYKMKTIGKRLLSLQAVGADGTQLTLKQAVLRTFIKLLPWEMTHLIILVPEPWYGLDESPANMFLIYVPNALLLIYIIILFLNKGQKALHDYAAQSAVMPAMHSDGSRSKEVAG